MSQQQQQETFDPEHPRSLIPELCRLFYQLNWATGTGGGISIRQDGKVYVAPSGVPKERIKPTDLFVLNEKDGTVLEAPCSTLSYKQSECTPLFFNAYNLRSAGACLHTHSQAAILVSMLVSGNDQQRLGDEFRITDVEMIKGIRDGETGKALSRGDVLVVPIIENVDFEKDLTEAMAACMHKYPKTNAIIVRNHGVYVWGATWQQAKGMVECYDYLFQLALEMRVHKIGMPGAASSNLMPIV